MLNAASSSPSPIVNPRVSRQPPPESGEGLLHAQLAFVQLRLVQLADLVGDSEHRHAPREDFVAQEQEAVALALLGRPVEYRLEHAPVGGQRGGQRFERLPLGRFEQTRYCASAASISWRVSSRL